MITFNNLKQFSEMWEEMASFCATYLGDHTTKLAMHKFEVTLPMWWGVCVASKCVLVKYRLCPMARLLVNSTHCWFLGRVGLLARKLPVHSVRCLGCVPYMDGK